MCPCGLTQPGARSGSTLSAYELTYSRSRSCSSVRHQRVGVGAAIGGDGRDQLRPARLRDVEYADPFPAALGRHEQRIGLLRVLRVAAGRGLRPVHAHEHEVLPDRDVALRSAALDVGDQARRGRLRDVDQPEAVVAALDQHVAPEGQVRVEEVERVLVLRQAAGELQLVRVAVREWGGVAAPASRAIHAPVRGAATGSGCHRGTARRRSRPGWPPPPRRWPTALTAPRRRAHHCRVGAGAADRSDSPRCQPDSTSCTRGTSAIPA